MGTCGVWGQNFWGVGVVGWNSGRHPSSARIFDSQSFGVWGWGLGQTSVVSCVGCS